MSIQFILVLNRQGKSRLVKWFNNSLTLQQKQQNIIDIHRLISSRDSKHQSNFVQFNPSSHQHAVSSKGQQQNYKLCYRRYAGLYFIISIDPKENELIYLESLHFFVEILDIYFKNVCEIDLIFNFYKLYFIMDEIYLGGEIQDISKQKILQRLEMLDSID
ncbi:aps2 [Candida pseudojiufengensis]|uniref:aps2 n=1 Tax=Candida pseudojiufengensis TaxID=497109 RepID=UPI0022246AED|nr:aps2 [Candida pseudojiufengensis]KAI5963670.1 aps2 [Candida pseudojiufengensis]